MKITESHFDFAHGSTLLTVPEPSRRERPEPVDGQPSFAATIEGGDPAVAGEPGEGRPTGYIRSRAITIIDHRVASRNSAIDMRISKVAEVHARLLRIAVRAVPLYCFA